MRRSILMLAAMITLGGAALARTNGSTPAPGASDAAAATVVHIKNFAYVPDSVTIHPGQAVRFVEDDETAHTVTASDKSYDSGNLDKGQSWTHTYAAAGTYKYFCAYHPYMTASITVQ